MQNTLRNTVCSLLVYSTIYITIGLHRLFEQHHLFERSVSYRFGLFSLLAVLINIIPSRIWVSLVKAVRKSIENWSQYLGENLLFPVLEEIILNLWYYITFSPFYCIFPQTRLVPWKLTLYQLDLAVIRHCRFKWVAHHPNRDVWHSSLF